MSQNPPPPKPPKPGSAPSMPPPLVQNPSNVQSVTMRMLQDMRADNAAAMQAMMTELAATRRIYANMEKMFDRLDTMQAELTAFRAETDRNFRRLESDIITAEGQNIQRQADILEAVSRISTLENA